MAQFLGVPGPSQDEFNALSGQVTTHDFGSLTVDAFKSALTAFVDSSMAQNELRPIRVAISTAADVFAQTIYVGWVSKNGESSTRTAVDLHAVSASDVVKRRVTGELYNTTWHFDNLALNSNLANYEPKADTITVPLSGVTNFDSQNFPGGAWYNDVKIYNAYITDVNNVVVLWSYYNTRMIFRFYDENLSPKSVTGTLKILYKK